MEQTVTVRVMALIGSTEPVNSVACWRRAGACAAGGSGAGGSALAAWLSVGLLAAWRRRRVNG